MPEKNAALSSIFVSRLGGGPSSSEDVAAIEDALLAALARARSAWPGIDLSSDAFAAELGDRVAGSNVPLAALEKLHTDDLFIACAVVHGVAGALAGFEERFFPEIARAVAKLEQSSSFADEAQQILRERLLLPRTANSGLATYVGKGPLTKWLRISAIRVVTRLREGTDRETDLDRLDAISDRALLATTSDPEIEYLKATYRREFRQAFHDALGDLSPRERNLLRLHTLDGLNGEQIAAFYGVSRASSSRWLARAKETLHARTRKLLGERLGLGPSQLESLAGLVLSQLDLSLGRVLQE